MLDDLCLPGPQPVRIHQMLQLGELIAAAFEEAERISSDPREVSRLATRAIENMLRGAHRVHVPTLIRSGALGRDESTRK